VANKKIQIIAGRLVREIARKRHGNFGHYLPALKLYQRVLSQKRGDSDKIYGSGGTGNVSSQSGKET
jgi:hypothetical protein